MYVRHGLRRRTGEWTQRGKAWEGALSFPKGRDDAFAMGPLEPGALLSDSAGDTRGNPRSDRAKKGPGPAGTSDLIADVAKRHRYWLRLIDRHLPSFVRSLVEPADVLQETYLRVLRQGVAFQGMSSEEREVWLLKIIARVIQNEVRKWERRDALGRLAAIAHGLHRGQRHVGDDDVEPEPESPWPGPEKQLSMAEEGERILRAIGSLPVELRIVFVFRHLGGRTVREISGALEISPNLVSSRLGHASEVLRIVLGPRSKDRN